MKQLADGQGSLLEEPEYFGERSFLAAATARFPELEAKLKQDPGVHVAMSVLSTATMEAAMVGDLPRVQDFYAFLNSILDQPGLHPEIPNAIAISYVVISQLRETVVGPSAIEQMPSSIRELIYSGAFR